MDDDEASEVDFDVEGRMNKMLRENDELGKLWKANPPEYDHDNREDSERRLVEWIAYSLGKNEDGSLVPNLRELVREQMEKSDVPRWHKEGDSYRESLLEAVDDQDDFYDPRFTKPEVDIAEHNGCYGYWESDDGNKVFKKVSNFAIEVDNIVRHNERGNSFFKLTVHPKNGQSYDVDVEPKVFNSKKTFLDNVVTAPSTRFDGGTKALNDIRELLASQASKEIQGTSSVGLTDDGSEFVTPEGTITPDGWKEDPDTVYVQRGVDVERRWSVSPDDDFDDEDVRRFLELIPDIRDSERQFPVLGWSYAAPLKPFFLDWIGEFPLLSITGDTGSGKTSTMQLLWGAFGMDSDPFSAGETPHAQLMQFSASDGVPVWSDEYRPTDMKKSRVDNFRDLARKCTRGASKSKGKQDQSTVTYRITSPIVVTGEQRFSDPSLLRRSITVKFTDSATKEPETRRAYSKLAGESYEGADGEFHHPDPVDLGAHAFEYYRCLTRKDREELKRTWHDCQADVQQILSEEGITNLHNSERKAITTVLFGLRMYQDFAESFGVNPPLDAVNVDEDVRDSLVYIATSTGDKTGRGRSHLEEFIETTARASMEGYLEKGEHYTLVHGNSQLRINLARSYDKVKRYHRDHDLDSDIFSKQEYLDRIEDAVEDPGSFVTTRNQKSPPVGRAFGINFGLIPDDIDIAVEMFDPEAEYYETGDSEMSDEALEEFKEEIEDTDVEEGTGEA